MRYLAGAMFLASCTMLAPLSTEDRPIEQPGSVIDSEPPESWEEVRKPKPRPSSAPIPELSSCANLNAGDLKETIKAKLDCIKENAK